MVYVIAASAVLVVAYPMIILLTAREHPRLAPSQRQEVEEQQRRPAVRLRLFLPAFGALLIVALWAAFGWHHQAWWYPLLIVVLAYFIWSNTIDPQR